jgi:hypothetical protein
MTNKIYECVQAEAKEEHKSISRMISDILEARYKNVGKVIKEGRKETVDPLSEVNEQTEDDKICYPIDNIPGKPLKAANKVWLRGEVITYGELIHHRYKQQKVRIAKADLRGVPLDQIIKEIEGE